MDKSSRDKTRSKNFKESEVKFLLDLVEKHKDVVECKKTDIITTKDKEAAWDVIGSEFNNLSGIYYRDVRTLRNKYENLKKTTKRKYADDKRYVLGTGGGPFVKTDFSENDIKVKSILGDIQVLGKVSAFDSDAVDNSTSQQELKFVANRNENQDKPWDITNIPVVMEEEVGLVEEEEHFLPTSNPIRRNIFQGFIVPHSEIPESVDEGPKPTSSGNFNVQESPKKLNCQNASPTKVTPASQRFPPFHISDLRSKTSSPLLTNKKKKSVLDTSLAGKKIEIISDAKKQVMDLQKDLYSKQIQFLEEEHKLKMRILEEEHAKKQKLLDLKIEREELELKYLKKNQ